MLFTTSSQGRDPRLPADPVGRGDGQGKPGPSPQSPCPPEGSGGPGVLLAEDEGVLRDLLTRRLRRAGLTVWPAGDGPHAFDLFLRQGKAVSVALLDVHMPGLDGTQVLAALRGIDPGLPCCFMTAGAGKYTHEDLLRCGAGHVLQKPFSVAQAVRVLRELTASVVGGTVPGAGQAG